MAKDGAIQKDAGIMILMKPAVLFQSACGWIPGALKSSAGITGQTQVVWQMLWM